MTKHIIFVRHGESIANAGLPTVDYNDTELTSLGQRQAHTVPDRLQSEYPFFTPDAIYSSHYKRAYQTALPSLVQWPDAVSHVLPQLCEFHYLDFGGRSTTTSDRSQKRQQYWQRCDPEYQDGSETETYTTFHERVISALELLQSSPYKQILVFTHGNFMRQLILSLSQDSQDSQDDADTMDTTLEPDYMK